MQSGQKYNGGILVVPIKACALKPDGPSVLSITPRLSRFTTQLKRVTPVRMRATSALVQEIFESPCEPQAYPLIFSAYACCSAAPGRPPIRSTLRRRNVALVEVRVFSSAGALAISWHPQEIPAGSTVR